MVLLSLLVLFLAIPPVLSAWTTCQPLGQGYWKNHYPDAWRDGTGLTLGSAVYTNEQLEGILNSSVRSDASVNLSHQLIAALLNMANGTDGTPIGSTIAHANSLLGAGPIPENVRANSQTGQQMTADAAVLENFNNGNITQSCRIVTEVPQASCQSAGAFPILVNGNNVTAYVSKGGFFPYPPSGRGSTGVAFVNIEGTPTITDTLVPTPDQVYSCAANSLSGQVVCVSNDNVYVINGTTITNTLSSGASGSIGFPFSGSCTNCSVTMDPMHNKAVIGMSVAGSPGYQFLKLGTNPTFEPPLTSRAGWISSGPLVDPLRNLMISASGGSGNYEIVDITNSSTPVFYEGYAGGGDWEAVAEDCSTGVLVAPFYGEVSVADLTQASFTPGTPGMWSAPYQVQGVGSYPASNIAVAQGTHTGVITTSDNVDFTAFSLPTTSGSGTPAITDSVNCSMYANWISPNAHTVAYKSPNTGHAMAVIWGDDYWGNDVDLLMVVDLTDLLVTHSCPNYVPTIPVP